MKKKLNIFLCLFIAILSCYFFVTFTKEYFLNKANGWVPDNVAPIPFVSGIITDGQPPPDFEAVIFETNAPAPAIVSAKPEDSKVFSVRVRISQASSTNKTLPPTFVFMKILQQDRRISSIILAPASNNGLEYVYSGQVLIPKKVGDYILQGEVEYILVQSNNGRVVNRNSFKKTTSRTILHVR